MKVLSVKNSGPTWHERFEIWISEASILSKYSEAGSVILAIDCKIHKPDDIYLRPVLTDYARCAGVIEATDQEMEILAGAGYLLTDLRDVGPLQLVRALEMRRVL
jgi:hypothetical protein